MTKCPTCDRDTLMVEKAGQQVTASDGTILYYEDEILLCGHCGETFYTPEQFVASTLARRSVLYAYEAWGAI